MWIFIFICPNYPFISVLLLDAATNLKWIFYVSEQGLILPGKGQKINGF